MSFGGFVYLFLFVCFGWLIGFLFFFFLFDLVFCFFKLKSLPEKAYRMYIA